MSIQDRIDGVCSNLARKKAAKLIADMTRLFENYGLEGVFAEGESVSLIMTIENLLKKFNVAISDRFIERENENILKTMQSLEDYFKRSEQ